MILSTNPEVVVMGGVTEALVQDLDSGCRDIPSWSVGTGKRRSL